MSRRPNYNLPTLGLENTPTVHQIKPHEGFTPEAVTHRAPFTLATGSDTPDPILAQPAGWTTQGLCHGDWDLFEDDTPDAVQLAQSICAVCPVQDTCLASALEGERWESGTPHPVDYRAGVRGGKTPVERVKLAAPARPDLCKEGHRLTEANAFLDPYRVKWLCNACRNEKKRARRAARNEAA